MYVCTYRWNYERKIICPTSETLGRRNGGNEAQKGAPWALLVGVYKKEEGEERSDGMQEDGWYDSSWLC
jgi:hypothetical protein